MQSLLDLIQASPVSSALLALAALLLYLFLDNYDYLPNSSIVKNLPSAGRGNWLTGHFAECFSYDPDIFSMSCFSTLGPVHTISGLLGKKRIVVQDAKALAHLVKNAYDYPKTAIVRGEIGRGVGHGVLWQEGENHRRQRRMLNPAFSVANTRLIAPVFNTLALQLADQIDKHLDAETVNAQATKGQGSDLDLYHWFFRAALDAIGLGGFGRNYGSIFDENQGVARLFTVWASNEQLDLSFIGLLQRLASNILPRRTPFLRNKRFDILADIQIALDLDAKQMCDERVAHLEHDKHYADDHRDLFTLLMKASLDTSGKEKLSEAEVFAQIKTFLFAGHETTSTGLSWTIHLLARHPHFQDKLREEILRAKAEAEDRGLDCIAPDDLDALPYLDAVLRESLRFRSPIPGRSFEAQKDDVIPLSTPVTLTNGRVITELPIKKGQELYTWHTVTNKRQDVWGYDGMQFNPERYIKDPDAGRSGDLKGAALWGQMMSFFGGPRSCIGYKFAIAEMKAIIAVLIERFQFHDTGVSMSARTLIVMRPCVQKDDDITNMMPIRVSKVAKA